MLHHTCEGKLLPSNMIFMAACNPYKMRDGKKTTAGLEGKVYTDEQSKLVYRVNPLPEGMMDYVWDYGSLDRRDEKKYILRMVEGKTTHEETLSKLLMESQTFLRNVEGTHYCVSLRDVHRAICLVQYFVEDFFVKKPMAKVRHDVGLHDSTISETEIRAWILAVAHCYNSRLLTDCNRNEYHGTIAKILLDIVPSMSAKYVKDVIREEQIDILQLMRLPTGTAKNVALRENVFVILVSILNKIPVFVVGKPGCSKSISMQVIVSNLRGLDSKCEFFKNLPTVLPVSYQGSESSTADDIIKVFQKAERIMAESKSNVLPVVVLDEIGLAEISRFNPLKVLHSLLEPTAGGSPAIAVVGISNWALDDAKMNRAIHLSRPEPTVEDLYKTAKSINEDVDEYHNRRVSDHLLRNLAEAYLQYVDQQVPKNFHGLRDYYSLVKYITIRSTEPGINDARLERGLLRNFGGLRQSGVNHMINMFMEIVSILQQHGQRPSVMKRIHDNLDDKLARHLMVITSGDSALTLLEQILQDREFKVKFGSRFEDDDSEEYNYRVLSEIILCMERGVTLVLRDLESIYGNLYDMLNQNYTIYGLNKRYCRISHGSYRSPLCEVHDDFRCIVLVEEDKIDYSDPPFLNRFEKQMLKFSDVLSDQQFKTVEILRQWMDDIAIVEGTQFAAEDMFVGLHTDTLTSLVYHRSDETCTALHTPSPVELSELCKNDLLTVACPDAVLRSSRSKLAFTKPDEVERFQQRYFNLKQSDGIRQYIDYAKKTTEDGNGLKVVVYTHSSIHVDLTESFKGMTGVQIERLSHFKSERQFQSTIRRFWFSRSDSIFLLKCSSVLDAPKMLLAKCLLDQYQKEYYRTYHHEVKFAKHACIVIHLDRSNPPDRNAQPTWQFNFLSGWQQVTIDDLLPCQPNLHVLVSHSVSKLIAGKHIETKAIAKDQILWGMTCLKYTVKQRDVDSVMTLIKQLEQNDAFLEMMEARFIEAIEDKEDLQQRRSSLHQDRWQVQVACDKELLAVNSTLSAALMEHIKGLLRRPLGKIIYFLERNSAWSGAPHSQASRASSSFWNFCFHSTSMFNINSRTIPEPRGLETCVIDTRRQDFMFPFFRIFNDKIESHRDYIQKQAKSLAEERDIYQYEESIAAELSQSLVRLIEYTIPELQHAEYLQEHIGLFYDDLCVNFAEEHPIRGKLPDVKHFIKWIFDKKLRIPAETTALEKLVRWYIGIWINGDLIAAELHLLVLCQELPGHDDDDMLSEIESEISSVREVRADVSGKITDEHDKVSEKTLLDLESEEVQVEGSSSEIEPHQLTREMDDAIVKVVCKRILPTEELLRLIGGVEVWQRTTGLLLLHAGHISRLVTTEHPIYHFLRVCRDFAAVLCYRFQVDVKTLAALAALGDCEKDPLSTNKVFQLIWGSIAQLMKKYHDDIEATKQLQQWQCMFYGLALESNPDTPVLDQILKGLLSDIGEPLSGSRPVLHRIIKTDLEEFTSSEEFTSVWESIIKTSEISSQFPSLQILDEILREEDIIDNHVAVITCDILEDIAADYVTSDRIQNLDVSNDSIVGTATETKRLLNETSTSDVRTLAAVAFLRAFFKSTVDVMHSKAQYLPSKRQLKHLAQELNHILDESDATTPSNRLKCLKLCLLKIFRCHLNMFDLREKCSLIQRHVTELQNLPWKTELFTASALLYSPLSYVEHYEDFAQALEQWLLDNRPSRIFEAIEEAKSDQSSRLGLLAVFLDRFFLTRSVRPLQDTEKQEAKWLSESSQVEDLDTNFQLFMKHLSCAREMSQPLQLNHTHRDHVELVSVIMHIACVAIASHSEGLCQFLSPDVGIKRLFLPGMGLMTSVLDDVDIGSKSWKTTCPSCKNVLVGKKSAYSKPMSGRVPCPICGIDVRPDDFDTSDRNDYQNMLREANSKTGYIRRHFVKTSSPDLAIRSLSPVSYRILDFILHSCILVGLSIGISNEDAVQEALELHSQNDLGRGPTHSARDTAWLAILDDWDVLQNLLHFKDDNTAVFLHSCLKQTATLLIDFKQGCKDAGARNDFEKKWSTVIQEEFCSRYERIKAFEKNAFSSMGLQEDSLEHAIDELCPSREATNMNDTLPRLFRQKMSTSFAHFKASAIIQSHTNPEKYTFLRLFLSQEKKLPYIGQLPRLLLWNRVVSEHLDRRIERKDGKRTIEEFLQNRSFHSSDKDSAEVRRQFEDFQDAWNTVREGWKFLTDEDVTFDGMSSDRPISNCLIEERGEDSALQQMITKLMDIQNEFLHSAMCIATSALCNTLAFMLRTSNVATLPTIALEESISTFRALDSKTKEGEKGDDEAEDSIIRYRWDDFRLVFCDVNTEYGKGTMIHYDYDTIERELAHDLILGKAILLPGQTFSRFFYSNELFHACSTILEEIKEMIPQKPLPKEVVNDIVKANDRVPNFTKNLMENMEIVLLFVKKSGGNADHSLHSYMKNWSAILSRSIPDNLLPTSIKLRHLVSLYETLEDLLTSITISSLHNCYLTKVDDPTVATIIKLCNTHDDKVEEVISTVGRFVFRYLRAGISTDPTNRLVTLIKQTAGKTLKYENVAELIPEEVTVGHVKHVLGVLKKQLEQRKEMAQKVLRTNIRQPTRRKRSQFTRY